jgi:hypothetical protein
MLLRRPKLVLPKVRRLSRRWDWIRKFSLPFEKFSGNDEDFYAFQYSTMNRLGQAGLARYLTDAGNVVSSNKEVAKAVLYAICFLSRVVMHIP